MDTEKMEQSIAEYEQQRDLAESNGDAEGAAQYQRAID